MRRIIVLLAALLAGSALFSGAPAHLAGASRVMGGQLPLRQASANVTTHGVRLVLELPGTAYPPNALVLATIHLTNLTKRDISTADCLSSSLSAEVVRQDGLAVYPPLLPPPGAPWTACIGSIAQPRALNVLHVLPGQTVTRMAYVVLRAFSVRARADCTLARRKASPR